MFFRNGRQSPRERVTESDQVNETLFGRRYDTRQDTSPSLPFLRFRGWLLFTPGLRTVVGTPTRVYLEGLHLGTILTSGPPMEF